MAIDPSQASGAPSPSSGARLDPAAGNQSTRQSGPARGVPPAPEPDGAAAGDRVQLSDQARGARTVSDPSASGMSAERLQEILKRMAAGYYDTPQVAEAVARKVADALNGIPGTD